jgi:S-DNA-T family DNA segregation ATPase FtsK/SpoIIIE
VYISGATGFYLNEWLVNTLGMAGSVLLLLGILTIYLVVVFNFSFSHVEQAVKWLLKPLFIKKVKPVEDIVDDPETGISPPMGESELPAEIDLYYEENSGKGETQDHTDAPFIAENAEPENIAASENDYPEMEVTQESLETDTQTSEILPSEELKMDVEVAESNEEQLSEDDVNKKLKEFGEYDPTLDLPKFKLPPLDLLENHGDGHIQVNKDELEANKNKIVQTLKNYNIDIQSIKATIGPTVTLYEIVPAAGVRISKIKNLEDDIALSLAALGIRIIAPIPGKGTIGIEVPNLNPAVVSMKAVLASEKFQNSKMELPLSLGKTISNETFVTDLTKMPHLLMAGATGQGKSVGLNAILVSILYRKHPSQVKFVLVDPKKVELTLFNKIERHYLAKLPGEGEPIITDTTKVVNTLNSLCMEMDERYELLKDASCRNIKEYNTKFIQRRLNPEKGHRFLPYIIVVVDEFADLIMTAGKEVETPIARIAQLARAIGIHLIIATQRPSVNIITGVIKANFPSRIAFRVTSKIDSRTILDTGGADQLIGRGDMLISNGQDLIRLQCAFVDTPEVERIVDYIGNQQGYPNAFILPEFVGESADRNDHDFDGDRDELFEDAARVVVQNQQGSASLLQRRLKLGYNRAGRLIDQLEAAGVIGPFKGSKAREVLISDEVSLEQFLNRGKENF